MSWEAIENHLFEKYCVEGEDKEFCKLQAEHDAETRAYAIDDFAEKMIDLVNEFPTVEDEFGELRPMTIEEMCNEIAEQLKGEKQ